MSFDIYQQNRRRTPAPEYSFTTSNSGLNAVTAATATQTNALRNMFEEIEKIGTSIGTYAANVEQINSQELYYDKSAEFTEGLTILKERFAEKINTEDGRQEFKKEAEILYNNIDRKGMRDIHVTRFNKQAQSLIGQEYIGLVKKIRDLKIAKAMNQLAQHEERSALAIADAGYNTTVASVELSDYAAHLADSQESGLITEQQSNDMLQNFHRRIDKIIVNRALQNDPRSTLALLKDPKQFRGLKIEDRENFIDSAQKQYQQNEQALRQAEIHALTLEKQQADIAGRETITRAALGEITIPEIKDLLSKRIINPDHYNKAIEQVTKNNDVAIVTSQEERAALNLAINNGVATQEDIINSRRIAWADKVTLLEKLEKVQNQAISTRDKRNHERLEAFIGGPTAAHPRTKNQVAAAIAEYDDRTGAGENPVLVMNEVATRYGSGDYTKKEWDLSQRLIGIWSLPKQQFKEVIKLEVDRGALTKQEAIEHVLKYDNLEHRRSQDIEKLFPRPTAAQLK